MNTVSYLGNSYKEGTKQALEHLFYHYKQFCKVDIFLVFLTSENTLGDSDIGCPTHPLPKTPLFFSKYQCINLTKCRYLYNLIYNLAILQTSDNFLFCIYTLRKVKKSCKLSDDLAKEVLIFLNEIDEFDGTRSVSSTLLRRR